MSAGVQACPLPAKLLLAEQLAEHMQAHRQRQSSSLSHLHVTSAERKLEEGSSLQYLPCVF